MSHIFLPVVVFNLEILFYRIHSLEEQLKDVEVKSKETLAEEQKKFKQMLVSVKLISSFSNIYNDLRLLALVLK